MKTSVKEISNLKSKELISISIIWTVLSLISSLRYIEEGFSAALVLFMCPLFIYWAIIWKFGPGSIMRYLSNLEFMKAIYSFINKVLKINNLENDIINGSALRKERLLILGILLSIMAGYTLFAANPVEAKIGIMILFAPLLYVSFKGYRLAIITLIAIIALDLIASILQRSNIISGFLWLAILSSIYIYALHVESIRTELEAAGKKQIEKRHPVRDAVIVITSYVVLLFIIIILSIGTPAA